MRVGGGWPSAPTSRSSRRPCRARPRSARRSRARPAATAMSTPAGRNVVRAARPMVSSASDAADRGPRALRVAAREAEERVPGLGRVAVLVRLPEGLLGLREVAEPQARLAELVEGRAGDARAPGPQLLARLARQLLGLVEAALEAHDLRVVHAAHAREGGHGVRVAELRGAVRPLRGAVEVGDLAARADRVAVDDERRIRVELAAERSRARLVEQQLALARPRPSRGAPRPGAGCRGSRGCGRRSACRSPRPAFPWRNASS